jgi:Na+-driven multidrug efflux pump
MSWRGYERVAAQPEQPEGVRYEAIDVVCCIEPRSRRAATRALAAALLAVVGGAACGVPLGALLLHRDSNSGLGVALVALGILTDVVLATTACLMACEWRDRRMAAYAAAASLGSHDGAV